MGEKLYRMEENRWGVADGNSVVIVASDEEGNYLCVRQFRQGIREVTTEFPAGGIERKDGKEYGKQDVSSEDALVAALTK